MHVILWEFQAKKGREPEFERAYGPAGDWARFFQRGEGYLGTTLLTGESGRGRYLTLDRWTSRGAYEAFRDANAAEYAALDRRLEALTERETWLGAFVETPP